MVLNIEKKEFHDSNFSQKSAAEGGGSTADGAFRFQFHLQAAPQAALRAGKTAGPTTKNGVAWGWGTMKI